MRIIYKTLAEKREGKRLGGRCEDNIKIDFKLIGWDSVNWIQFT
jgi:hypothetical protein